MGLGVQNRLDNSFLKENLAELISTCGLIIGTLEEISFLMPIIGLCWNLFSLKLYLQEVYTPVIKYYRNMFYIIYLQGRG